MFSKSIGSGAGNDAIPDPPLPSGDGCRGGMVLGRVSKEAEAGMFANSPWSGAGNVTNSDPPLQTRF